MELFVQFDHDTNKVTLGPQSGMAGEPGWLRYIGDNDLIGPNDTTGDRYIEELGIVLRVTTGTIPEPTFTEQRTKAYPKIGDQFDLLFHDISTFNLSIEGGFYQALLAVKTQYPKD